MTVKEAFPYEFVKAKEFNDFIENKLEQKPDDKSSECCVYIPLKESLNPEKPDEKHTLLCVYEPEK